MRELLLRGLRFERGRAQLLRDEAEMYVGVKKSGSGVRFADVLVLEEKPPASQPPRVETFSFKSRDFSAMGSKAMEAQMLQDAREALAYYGGTLEIVRPELKQHVKVQRIRLVYEGGALKPVNPRALEEAVNATKDKVPGVEVLFH